MERILACIIDIVSRVLVSTITILFFYLAIRFKLNSNMFMYILFIFLGGCFFATSINSDF